MKKKFYAYDREIRKVVKVKSKRAAERIVDKGGPEYEVTCPKCKCLFGVN